MELSLSYLQVTEDKETCSETRWTQREENLRSKSLNCKGDFGLWKFKMLAQLEIQGLLSAMKEEETLQQ